MSVSGDGENKQAGGCPVAGIGARFDPFDGEPERIYPLFAEARFSEPVFYSERLGYWVVTRYEDVRQALGGDPAVFSAGNVLELVKPLCPAAGAIAMQHGIVISPSVVDEDPPLHTAHRKSLHVPFARGRMQAMEPMVRELMGTRLDALVSRGRMDLVSDLLFEVPAYILFELFGVPRSELGKVRQFAQRLAVLGFGRPSDDEQVAQMRGLAEFWDYCRAHVARLIAHPGDDAISEFIRGFSDPRSSAPLDADYVTTVTFQLFFAGHETTVNATAGGMRALLENREQWQALCEDATLIPNAVEECLRYAPSVPAWRRITRQPIVLGGVAIPAGARLLIGIGSANRDEQHFADGERFDIHRHNARDHLAFGFGRHHCLGADLARIEMRVILTALARRLPELTLDPDQQYQYSPNTSHRGPEHVMVHWPVAGAR